MKSRQHLRTVSTFVVAVLLVQLSPVPVLASSSDAGLIPNGSTARTSIQQQIRKDLSLLIKNGKEAYLDVLFERLDADQASCKKWIRNAVHATGARKLGMLILGLGFPVLAAALAVIPESWEESLVVAALHRFVAHALADIKALLSGLSAQTLQAGLRAMLKLISNPAEASSALVGGTGDGQGQSWWERFFSDSTMVRNFLIVVVTLSSIGVAVGLAIAGASSAPIVAVIAALVSLIALLNSHGALLPLQSAAS